jgi:hypothetical protein
MTQPPSLSVNADPPVVLQPRLSFSGHPFHVSEVEATLSPMRRRDPEERTKTKEGENTHTNSSLTKDENPGKIFYFYSVSILLRHSLTARRSLSTLSLELEAASLRSQLLGLAR